MNVQDIIVGSGLLIGLIFGATGQFSGFCCACAPPALSLLPQADVSSPAPSASMGKQRKGKQCKAKQSRAKAKQSKAIQRKEKQSKANAKQGKSKEESPQLGSHRVHELHI